MKKYSLGLVAILLAIGFSAFTNPKPKKLNTDYYWFEMNSGVSIEPSNIVSNNQVTYLDEFDDTPPSIGCTTSTYNCVVGFTSGQVTGSPGFVKLGQTPVTASTRP